MSNVSIAMTKYNHDYNSLDPKTMSLELTFQVAYSAKFLGIYIMLYMPNLFFNQTLNHHLFTHFFTSFPFSKPALSDFIPQLDSFNAIMLLSSYLAILSAIVMVTDALPKPPKLSINTNVQPDGQPSHNDQWPKTI